MKLPRRLQKLEKPQLKLVAIVLSVLIILGLGWLIIVKGSDGDKTPKVQGGASIKLSFTPITAPGKSLIPDPEGKRDTGSYRDKIGEVNIRISEQALPNDFRQDTETKLADFAKNNYYNETFMAGPVKVYSGLSIKGVQSIVFTKAGLLVFIKAESRVENNDMADYIKSLR